MGPSAGSKPIHLLRGCDLVGHIPGTSKSHWKVPHWHGSWAQLLLLVHGFPTSDLKSTVQRPHHTSSFRIEPWLYEADYFKESFGASVEGCYECLSWVRDVSGVQGALSASRNGVGGMLSFIPPSSCILTRNLKITAVGNKTIVTIYSFIQSHSVDRCNLKKIKGNCCLWLNTIIGTATVWLKPDH